ncbi:MAG: efflux RND transporter permease subunit [Burkholderiales bacterium]|nr:efflux RND transporter permease subunit [Burkholderiales bacterium]
MLNALVRASIRHRGIVVVLAALLFGYGLYTLQISRRDVFPEFAPPLAIVQTTAPGLSAEQVEALVTQPVEDALGGLPGVATMKSKSLPGLSLITASFDDDVDAQQAQQRVASRLAGIGSALPAGVTAPVLLPLTSSTSVVLVAALTSASRSLPQLSDLAEWTLKPRLRSLPGVADVVVFGGQRRQWQVQVDPQRLFDHGLTMDEVLAAARQASGVRSAGFIEGANQRLALRTEGQLRAAADLARIPVAWRGGLPIRLGDVARVSEGVAPAVGAARLDGEPAVMLVIESQYGADPLTVTAELDRAFAQFAPALAQQQVVLDTSVFRPAREISEAMRHLDLALALGAALVLVLLFLFLHDWRSALISACAIPLSLLVSVIVLHRWGIGLNTMTLGGLAIALGEVVDDAIVDVENILRRLRENRAAALALPAPLVIWRASIEVRGAVVYASFIVALAFLPVLALSGVAGKLFSPLGKAYVFSVLASLGVALTLTPALACLLLAGAPPDRGEPRFVLAIKRHYTRWLTAIERHTTLGAGFVAALCLAALACLPLLAGSFIPALKPGHYTVHMALAPGTSLAETVRIGDRVSAALRAIPGVRLVAQRAGRAEDMVDPADVHMSEFEVDLESMGGAAQTATLARMQAVLRGFPGMSTSVNTFLAERIDETISGYAAPVIVNVRGDDLDRIDDQARRIARVLAEVPGAVGVRVAAPPGTPQLVIRLRPPLLDRYALRPLDVLDTVQAAFEGARVGQIVRGNRVTDITVRLDPAHRRSPADIGRLMLRNGAGLELPLSAVAEIGEQAGRAQINHSRGQRLQAVTCDVRGRAVADFVRDAQARIAREVTLPEGTYAVFEGEAQARAQALRELLVHAALALGGIGVLLVLALRSARALALVVTNLPFALVGGVAAALLTGSQLSLGAVVGFVTLFGITLRNSIMLISHYQHLVGVEGMTWGPEAALRGARERLLPILMTAAVTALGLLPLALRSGEPGNEVEGPMAIVILGGLVTSTLLNLLLLPAFALRYGRFVAPDAADDPLAAAGAAPGPP